MKQIIFITVCLLCCSIAKADYMPAGARLMPDVEIKSEKKETKTEIVDQPIEQPKPQLIENKIPKELSLNYSVSNIEARNLLKIQIDNLNRQGSMLLAVGCTAAIILAGVGMGLAIAGSKDLSTGKIVVGSIMSSTGGSIGWTLISIGTHKKTRAKDLSLVYYALPEQTTK